MGGMCTVVRAGGLFACLMYIYLFSPECDEFLGFLFRYASIEMRCRVHRFGEYIPSFGGDFRCFLCFSIRDGGWYCSIIV